MNNAIIDYLKEFRDDVEEANDLKEFVSNITDKVKIVFGENAFKRVDIEKATSINKTIAELQMVVLSKFEFEAVKLNKNRIRESFKKFVEENDENIFIRGTNNTNNVEKRYKWGKIVSEILKES